MSEQINLLTLRSSKLMLPILSNPTLMHNVVFRDGYIKLVQSSENGHLQVDDLFELFTEVSLYNRRFPSCLSSLFQSDSKCETFHVEVLFTCKKKNEPKFACE